MTKIQIDVYYNRPRAVKVRVEPEFIVTPRTSYTASQGPHSAFVMVILSVIVALLVSLLLITLNVSKIKCDDIVQEHNYYTGKMDTVCETILESN